MNNILKQGLCLIFAISLILLPLVLGASCNQCGVGEDYLLKEYYVSIEPWNGLFDDSGIPMVDYGGEIGYMYDPATISQHALANFELYLETCDNEYREKFLDQADWLLENLVLCEARDFYVLEYDFDYGQFDMEAPWISAVAQSQGISTLLRAYEVTGEEKYLEAAEAAPGAFEKTINEGGVSYIDRDGFSWYEEYPASKPPHVLNGFIYALFGLYDLYKSTGSEKALGLFNDGVETLEANLHEYDTGSWSAYYLPGENDPGIFNFRLKTQGAHPQYSHPIDEISLLEALGGEEKILVILDVGHEDDTTDIFYSNSSLSYDPLYSDWSRSYVLDGRTARNYEDYGAMYPQAPFKLRFTVNPSAKYYMDICYKDISTEVLYVDVYVVGNVNYTRLGEMQAGNSGEWRTGRIEVPISVLAQGHGATGKEHRLHIEQLEALHMLTGKDVFSEYALKFDGYLP